MPIYLDLPGLPVLRGPFVVDYTDIPHDGDKKTLWTPQVGDCLLALYGDLGTNITAGTANNTHNGGLDIGTAAHPSLIAGLSDFFNFHTGGCYVFGSASPVQVMYDAQGDGDLTAGHVELYALVATPLAPT
jgi:hypothetical protein